MNFRKALAMVMTLLTLWSSASPALAQSDLFHNLNGVPPNARLKHSDSPIYNSECRKNLIRPEYLLRHDSLENFIAANPSDLISLTKHETGSWVSLGPEGGWIGNLLMHPSDHNTLYAQTDNSYPTQFFRSTDGGATWTILGRITDNIFTSAIDPNNPKILYAASGNYIYKSLDGGATWNQYQKDTKWSFTSDIYVCPTNSNLVYAAGHCYTNKSYIVLHKSTNGGLNWTAADVSPSSYQNGYCYSLAVNPANPNILYIGGYAYDGSVWNGLLFKSSDGGATWSNIFSSIEGYIYTISIDPTATNKVYVGTYAGVYRSSDSGASWQKNSAYVYAYKLAIDPKNTKIIYAGAYKSIYKSTDSGINWTNYQSGLFGDCICLIVDHTNPNNLFYGSNVGVFKSSNSGVAWSAANTGLLVSTITTMEIAPSDPKILFIEFAGNAIFKTTDSGNRWTRLNEFLACGNIGAIAVPSTSAEIVFALEGSG